MRKLLALGAAMLLSLPATALAQGALGANYNEHFEDVDYRDLKKSDTQWVRLFLPMHQLDRGPATEHGAVKTILDVGTHGYKTVLTLKFPYNRVAFPKVDSDTFKKDLARLDKVLPEVMGKVDILVIGNEPFIESRQQDWNSNFNAYYEALAKAAIKYRAEKCGGNACKTHLYMGALNQTQNPVWRNKTTDRWMEFIKETPELEGLDIHPHITMIEESKAFLDYILPRMRPEQKFLVLEFSLVWWWKSHLKDPIPAAFAAKYGAPANAQEWQIIKAALETPFSKQQWDEFLAQSPWFENRKHYLLNQMKIFRATGRLAVATYGFKQGSSMAVNFGPDSVPWLLNSVFAGRTVKPNPDGSAATNYSWFDDYKALQKK
jgi:hypothetical protein